MIITDNELITNRPLNKIGNNFNNRLVTVVFGSLRAIAIFAI